MSKVMSLRLKEDQIQRLDRVARRQRRTRSEMAALLLEEQLRATEFPYIEFKDTMVGRQAFISGTRLKIWQVEWLAREYDHDVAKVAEHLNLLPGKITSALAYAAAFPDEIEDAIVDNQRLADEMQRRLEDPRGSTTDLTTHAPTS